MAAQIKNSVSKRLIEVIDYFKKNKNGDSYLSIAKAIGWKDAVKFNDIKINKSTADADLVNKIGENYSYVKKNKQYIIFGDEPMFKEKESEENKIHNKNNMNEDHPMFKMMQQLISHNEKIANSNETLARTNEKLANEILSLIKNGGIAEFQAKT